MSLDQKRTYRLAVIPGDGIGKETTPEGVRVLEAAAKKFGFDLQLDHFDFSSYDYYAKHGRMLPEDWKEQIGSHDAIFFGAVGWPEKIPDHVSLWGSLLQFRREFDQYINLRPVRLMPGVPTPLANRKPGDIDFWVVRENTEGEYSSIGGKMFPGTEREVVIQETVMTRIGVDRVLQFAFDLAQKRPKKHLTSATKSNGISITMPYWDERVEEMAKRYPDVKWDKYHIDILTAHFVLHPDWFDVVVASNLFGDILSDLGPACTGTIGIAPSGNINPDGDFPVALRAGSRLGAGHCRAGDRKPDRPDLGGRHDAGASRRGRSCRSHRPGHRGRPERADPAHPRSRRQCRNRDHGQGRGRRPRLTMKTYRAVLDRPKVLIPMRAMAKDEAPRTSVSARPMTSHCPC